MRRSMPAILFFLILVWVSGPVLADAPEGPRYLPAGAVDGVALIGPPAAVGSVPFEQQMAIVLWLQKTRTPAQVTFVETKLDAERFAPLISQELMDVDGIELKHVIDAVIDEVRADYDAVKDVYDLPRPFQVSDAVEPVGDARPVASYPSGHAIRAIVYARTLAAIFPEREEELMDLAHRTGYGRVIAGVHYPMDVIAGQKLGHAYADVIVEQPAFTEAVERIRGERPPSRETAARTQ